MPLPSPDRLRALATRWNRSNSRGSSSARDPGAGVAHGELRAAVDLPQPNGDDAGEGELQGVGEQVEDDLLPHVPVDVHRLVQRGTVDGEVQPGPVDGGPEDAGQLRGRLREVDRLEAGVDPAGLQAGEVEQGVDELPEAQRVALDDLELLADPRVGVEGRGGPQFGDRSHDQRQRRPELVAHVAEEVGLRPVELGQGLGPAALGLVATGVEQTGRDLVRHQLDEPPVAVVPAAVRVESHHQEAGHRPAIVRGGGDRHGHRLGRRLLPRPGRQVREPAVEVLDQHLLTGAQAGQRPDRGRVGGDEDRRCRGRARRDPGSARQPGVTRGIEEVCDAERQVGGVAAQLLGDGAEHVGLRPGAGDGRREIPEVRHPALADDPLGVLRDHAEHALGAAVPAVERAVGERVVGLLRVAAALEEQQQVLVPGGHAGVEHRLDPRADVVPDLRPHLARGTTQRPRVLGLQGVPPVGVVVEHREVRAPRRPHGEPGRQQDPDGVAQLGGPGLRGPDRRLRPVPRAHGAAELAVVRDQRALRGLAGHRSITEGSLGRAQHSGSPAQTARGASATRPPQEADPSQVCGAP